MIWVKILNPKTGKEIQYYALIDSGSDECIFDAEVGEAIGLNIKKGTPRPLQGVIEGKKATYWIHDVELKVGGWPYKVPIGFMYDLAKVGYGLLGQRGFFDQFKSVKFEKRKGNIEIKRFD